jgi:hypothetical protein
LKGQKQSDSKKVTAKGESQEFGLQICPESSGGLPRECNLYDEGGTKKRPTTLEDPNSSNASESECEGATNFKGTSSPISSNYSADSSPIKIKDASSADPGNLTLKLRESSCIDMKSSNLIAKSEVCSTQVDYFTKTKSDSPRKSPTSNQEIPQEENSSELNIKDCIPYASDILSYLLDREVRIYSLHYLPIF